MRTILILRGAPGSGKSTFVEKNGLQAYTLSSDNIRLLYQSPVLTASGKSAISQQNDDEVWELLLQLAERRMRKGEFLCIDATHYKSSLLDPYKKLISKYRYRAFVVDFTHVPLETVLKRNMARPAFKQVPESVIHKMYEVFNKDREVISRFKVISPEEAEQKLDESLLFDYNNYNRIVAFGDIHGCFEPVKAYFDKYPFDKNTAYIFLGDYIDRGLQNKETLEFLMNLVEHKNVMLLEGNHEHWLRLYAHSDTATEPIPKQHTEILAQYLSKSAVNKIAKNSKIRSREFLQYTLPQISSIPKKALKKFCDRFSQMAYVSFGNKKYFFCHGAIPIIPDLFVNTEELIHGVGKYDDIQDIYAAWNQNTPNDTVLVHGHRNSFKIPAVQNRAYNLCSKIESGAPLRILTIDKDGTESVEEFANPLFDPRFDVNKQSEDKPRTDPQTLIDQLNNSELIIKKELEDNIVAYNFSRRAFYNRNWNGLTCKARGLFVDVSDNSVAARSYDKFFNWDEVQSTKTETLASSLKFPVYAFRKENGFLAMLSFDKNNDCIRFCSKSNTSGPFVDYIKNIFHKLPPAVKRATGHYLKNNNVTMVFECVDTTNDPHIISYDSDHLFLLDVIDNSFETKRMPYQDIFALAASLGLESKVLDTVFFSMDELYAFKKHQESPDSVRYEGWVLEDSNGFMLKLKTHYYKFWKAMRSLKHQIQNNQKLTKTFASADEIKVYNYMRALHDENKLADMSIIDIQKLFHSPAQIS